MNIEDYKYKIELHAHSKPCSRCSHTTPERLVELYVNKGVDAVVIVNHFQPDYFYYKNFESKEALLEEFLGGYKRAYEYGKEKGLTVILGMEIRFDENSNDYLLFGIDEEFISKASDYLMGDLATFYKEMKNDKNVIIQAHPDRGGMTRMPLEYLDGLETFNMNIDNSRVSLTAQYAMENNVKITTCGSDFHDESYEALALVRSKWLPKDTFEIAELLKSGDYLFDFFGNIVIPTSFRESSKK